MARRGRNVLVLEAEEKFRDRVRGEQLATWGTAEARELGLLDLLVSSCATEERWWDIFFSGTQVQHRNLIETTAPGLPNLTFFHPDMQEALLREAAQAGAEVRRGVRVKAVQEGPEPAVVMEQDGKPTRIAARLVVGADGRNSMTRAAVDFETTRDPDRLQIGGILMEGCPLPLDTAHFFANPSLAITAPIFPQGDGRARVYLVTRVDDGPGHSGEKDLSRFLEGCERAGVDRSILKSARFSGPLATFKGADSWVEHPYRDGVALLGDAAGHSDPSWGQGLSLTMRDVRVLRDRLSETDDWDAAGAAYARERNSYFMLQRKCEDWFTQFFYETGDEAEARRARVFSLVAQDPKLMPDNFQSGPESTPLDEAARRRFFAEE
jgi:2-polyprenyl-6-methoxyphenol hydroxylase-like FAD-dependent oxidoreductase